MQSFECGAARAGWFPQNIACAPQSIILPGTTVLAEHVFDTHQSGYLTLENSLPVMVEVIGVRDEKGWLYGFDLRDLNDGVICRGWFPLSAVSRIVDICVGSTVQARLDFEGVDSGYLTLKACTNILVQFVGTQGADRGWLYGIDLSTCFIGDIPQTPRLPFISGTQGASVASNSGQRSVELLPATCVTQPLATRIEQPPVMFVPFSARSHTLSGNDGRPQEAVPVLANTDSATRGELQLVPWTPQRGKSYSAYQGRSLLPETQLPQLQLVPRSVAELPTLNWSQEVLRTWMKGFDWVCLQAECWQLDYFRQHPYTDVYNFVRSRLHWNAARCYKRKSDFDCMLGPPAPQLASVANLQSGDLVEAAIFSKGQSNMESQTPRRDWEPESRWWPVVVRLVPGWNVLTGRMEIFLVPFYCPSLAANGGRPWYVHISRVWLVSRL